MKKGAYRKFVNAYKDFLNSEEWKQLRENRLEKDHNRCVICGSQENLNVHHTNYENIRNSECLVTLCRDCHSRWHHEVFPKIKSGMVEINAKFAENLYSFAREYENARAELVLEHLTSMIKNGKFADKCRVARLVNEAHVKGFHGAEIYFRSLHNAILKGIGGKGVNMKNDEARVKFK